MKITDIALGKSLTVFALMVIVTIMGVHSYIILPKESTPDVKIPYVMVTAPYVGTSPADMENLVTRKLEKELKSLADLKQMTSTSSEGMSTIVLEFTPDVEMSDALQKVRDAVELAKPDLPQDVKDDLVVYELSSDDWPIMQVVLSGDYDLIKLKKVGEDVQEALEQVQGVLGVDLTGGVEREVRVDVDPERLRFYDLGLGDVMDAIREQNITIPGGELALGTYEYQVRVPGEFEHVDVIENIILNTAEATPVYIRDVANVSFGIKDRDSISRLDRVDSVTLSVKKRSGENLVRIADDIYETLDRLKPSLPEGTHIVIVGDHAVFVNDIVTELQDNILSGLVLVVACLFLFLGLTNSFFVGAAIPLSMLLSFIVIRMMGITLNMVVLFSLILALGMLVDNAIVIVENIFRLRTQGLDAQEAARLGTHQVSSPVIASTVTTLCAFAPLVFWPGIMGEFMKYLPITVIVTLTASLLVALIFNPVLCSRFMKIPQQSGSKPRLGDRLIAWGLDAYEPALRWALRKRAVTFLGTGALFLIVFVLFLRYNHGLELFPDTDPTFAYVTLEAPSGTRIELSDAFCRQAESKVEKIPDLKAFVTEVGGGGGGGSLFGGGPSHVSTITMEFVKNEERSQSSRKGLSQLREALADFTGAKILIEKAEEGPPTGKPVNIEISGDDFNVLGDLSDAIQERIRNTPGLVDLQDDYDRGRPEIQVIPDLEKASRLGLRTLDVASTVRTAIHGDDVSKFRVGEDEYDIVVRLDQPARKNVEDIEDLSVFYEGKNIPLMAFADVVYTTSLASINRIDAKRVVTVSADVATGYNGNAVLAQVKKTLADFTVPPGYQLDFTGESEDQEEAIAFLSDAFSIAIMLILVVLVTQFNSVTTPFVIISSVLLSLMGVFIGLLVAQLPFGIIMTGVGVISLAGVVVNNAIVLLHYVIMLRNQGKEKLEAIVEAGRTRFRPVLLTAITTILGLIPLTTGFAINFGRLFSGDFTHAVAVGGDSSAWWGPMGVAVIFGLSIATFLTLIVVPVMYSTVDPVLRFLKLVFFDWWWRLVQRRRSAAEGAAA